MRILENIIEDLSAGRDGKFGVVETGIDWFPDADPDAFNGEIQSMRIAMHPETARNLAELSNALRAGKLFHVDIDFYPGAVDGETIRNVVLAPLSEKMDPDLAVAAKPGDAFWEAPGEDWNFKVKVSAHDVRLIFTDADMREKAAAIFGPDRLVNLIEKSAAMDATQKESGKTPRMA